VSYAKCDVPKTLKSSELDFSNLLSPHFRFHVLTCSDEVDYAGIVSEKFKEAKQFVDVPVDQKFMDKPELQGLFLANPLDVDSTLSELFFDDSNAFGVVDVVLILSSEADVSHRRVLGVNRTGYIVLDSFDSVVDQVKLLTTPVYEAYESLKKRIVDNEDVLLDTTNDLILDYTLLFEDSGDGAKWKFANLAKTYITPFCEKISPVIKCKSRSSIIRYARINADNGISSLTPDDIYIIDEEATPFLLRSPNEQDINWKLDNSRHSDYSEVVHFVLVVPAEDRSPLFVFRKNDIPNKIQNFIIPKRAAVYIANELAGVKDLTDDFFDLPMATFHSQLRK